jgi:hypothetical protein
VNRVVARMDANGAVDTSTTLGTAFSGGSVRAVASVNESAYWIAGTGSSGTGGVYYASHGGASSETQVVATPSNVRVIGIFASTVFISSASGTPGILQVDPALPTVAGATATALTGLTETGLSPYAFVVFDHADLSSGVDTIYLADDRVPDSGGGVQKWTKTADTWVKDTAYVPVGLSAGCRGLTGFVSGTSVKLLCSTKDNVYLVEDDFVNHTPTVSALVTAATNTVFRGIALSPQ